jgi:hypothetical protein
MSMWKKELKFKPTSPPLSYESMSSDQKHLHDKILSGPRSQIAERFAVMELPYHQDCLS